MVLPYIIAAVVSAVSTWWFMSDNTEECERKKRLATEKKKCLDTEKKKLSEKHEVTPEGIPTRGGINDIIPNLKSGVSTISMCSRPEPEPFLFPHKKFFLKLEEKDDRDFTWTLNFSPAGTVEITHCFGPLEMDVEKTTKVTDFHIHRLNQIHRATNFSYCLRNDEHLARFVMDGVWLSFQMIPGGAIRNMFNSILTDKAIELTATIPKKLRVKRDPSGDRPLFNNHDGLDMIKFKKNIVADDFKLTEQSFNIIIVGPTGSGKSSLINYLFNLGICEAMPNLSTAASVTREHEVIHGEFKCADGNVIDVNVLDTMGLCDQFVEDTYAVDKLCKSIFKTKLDRIVVLTSGNISSAHCKAIEAFKKKLHYADNKDFFYFIYNKTEKEDQKKKMELVTEMGTRLKVDVNHKIPIPIKKPDDLLETDNYIRAGLACGVDVSDLNNEVSRKGIKILKDALLPRTANILQSPKRMSF